LRWRSVSGSKDNSAAVHYFSGTIGSSTTPAYWGYKNIQTTREPTSAILFCPAPLLKKSPAKTDF
jgi:hypothetical protein